VRLCSEDRTFSLPEEGLESPTEQQRQETQTRDSRNCALIMPGSQLEVPPSPGELGQCVRALLIQLVLEARGIDPDDF